MGAAFQSINTLPPDDQFGRPEDLRGWEDVLHKAELSEEEKAQIDSMQVANDLLPTQFKWLEGFVVGKARSRRMGKRTSRTVGTQLAEQRCWISGHHAANRAKVQRGPTRRASQSGRQPRNLLYRNR